jgi:hypothetical protein
VIGGSIVGLTVRPSWWVIGSAVGSAKFRWHVRHCEEEGHEGVFWLVIPGGLVGAYVVAVVVVGAWMASAWSVLRTRHPQDEGLPLCPGHRLLYERLSSYDADQLRYALVTGAWQIPGLAAWWVLRGRGGDVRRLWFINRHRLHTCRGCFSWRYHHPAPHDQDTPGVMDEGREGGSGELVNAPREPGAGAS